jgi:hypothetical protein
MAATYELIASNTLTTSAASVTFSSIPATFTDLVFKGSVRSDGTPSSAQEFINIRFNGVSSAYSLTRIRTSGTPAAIASISQSNQAQHLSGLVASADATADTFGSYELYLPSYTVSQNKPSSAYGVTESNNTDLTIMILAQLWSNTAAVNSINFFPTFGSNWVSGSSFFLYGIKNS